MQTKSGRDFPMVSKRGVACQAPTVQQRALLQWCCSLALMTVTTQGAYDWALYNDQVVSRLQQYHKDGYRIVIFT